MLYLIFSNLYLLSAIYLFMSGLVYKILVFLSLVGQIKLCHCMPYFSENCLMQMPFICFCQGWLILIDLWGIILQMFFFFFFTKVVSRMFVNWCKILYFILFSVFVEAAISYYLKFMFLCHIPILSFNVRHVSLLTAGSLVQIRYKTWLIPRRFSPLFVTMERGWLRWERLIPWHMCFLSSLIST